MVFLDLNIIHLLQIHYYIRWTYLIRRAYFFFIWTFNFEPIFISNWYCFLQFNNCLRKYNSQWFLISFKNKIYYLLICAFILNNNLIILFCFGWLLFENSFKNRIMVTLKEPLSEFSNSFKLFVIILIWIIPIKRISNKKEE